MKTGFRKNLILKKKPIIKAVGSLFNEVSTKFTEAVTAHNFYVMCKNSKKEKKMEETLSE